VIRLIFLLGIAWLAYLGLRSLLRNGQGTPPAGPAGRRPEQMVRCQVCGLNLPASEALPVTGGWACCAEHARAGGPADPAGR
jgi:hypothetical protein